MDRVPEPHYCDCTVVYGWPVIGIDHIQQECAHTTHFWSPDNYRMYYCHLHLSFTYYQEVLRMDSVVIYLAQSAVPVLLGTSGEPHWVVDSAELVLVDNHTDRHHSPAHTYEKVCEHMISRSTSAPANSSSKAYRLTGRRAIARKEALSPWIGRWSML